MDDSSHPFGCLHTGPIFTEQPPPNQVRTDQIKVAAAIVFEIARADITKKLRISLPCPEDTLALRALPAIAPPKRLADALWLSLADDVARLLCRVDGQLVQPGTILAHPTTRPTNNRRDCRLIILAVATQRASSLASLGAGLPLCWSVHSSTIVRLSPRTVPLPCATFAPPITPPLFLRPPPTTPPSSPCFISLSQSPLPHHHWAPRLLALHLSAPAALHLAARHADRARRDGATGDGAASLSVGLSLSLFSSTSLSLPLPLVRSVVVSGAEQLASKSQEALAVALALARLQQQRATATLATVVSAPVDRPPLFRSPFFLGSPGSPDEAAAPADTLPIFLTSNDAPDYSTNSALRGRVNEDEAGPPGQRAPTDVGRFTVPSVPPVGGFVELRKRLRTLLSIPLLQPTTAASFCLSLSPGVLLVGPPGCGKTTLALEVAHVLTTGESAADTPVRFFSVSAASLLSKWFGETEARIRRVFKEARACSPSLILIDEIDALVPERGASDGSGGGDVGRRILGTLLVELDGVRGSDDQSTRVAVIATTARPDLLDAALCRPGRFDERLEIPAPTHADYVDIFRAHATATPALAAALGVDENRRRLASLCAAASLSPASVSLSLSLAALRALEEDAAVEEITLHQIITAIEAQ
uniref:AAA+ ATPase domain-containing protein n=1 Tax=Sexangularia sp. CB-2014 TaxID=1486929 RepID=A0A7S1VL88_9EUKA